MKVKVFSNRGMKDLSIPLAIIYIYMHLNGERQRNKNNGGDNIIIIKINRVVRYWKSYYIVVVSRSSSNKFHMSMRSY